MRLLTLDVESFYSQDFSLRKITVPEYILSPQWETLCLGIKFDDAPAEIIDGPAVQAFFDSVNPKNTITISHNSLFDACVFAWRYGFVPSCMIDTMGLARMLRGHILKGVSLETVAEYFHLPPKGHTIAQVKGMHRADIMGQPELWQNFKSYCAHDVDLTYQIFTKLAPEVPPAQWRVMDLVLRAAVEPQFVIDYDLLKAHYDDVVNEKEELMRLANTDKDSLMSNDKFAERLTSMGIEIGMKPSPSDPAIEIPAFAKTDEFMSSLLEHEDPQVQALAAARLGVKSTLEEKRSQRLLAIAKLPWEQFNQAPNAMPIPLRYAGAHTMRLSGNWQINMQNLPTGRGGKKTKLRHALKAPSGSKVVVGDLGQVHARLTAWLSKAPLLQIFKDGEDPYCSLASDIFKRPITKADEMERFIGKAGVLGLGFGCAAPKFYAMVLRSARAGGMDLNALKKIWTLDLAEKVVQTYRKVERKTEDLWYKLDMVLGSCWYGTDGVYVGVWPVKIGQGYVEGPSGLTMRYVVPEPDADNASDTEEDKTRRAAARRRNMFYHYAKRKHKIYGAAFLENIVQFLEVEIMQAAATRIAIRGFRWASQSHDELAYVVKDEDVDKVMEIVYEELIRPPSWALDLPLTASVNCGPSYGEAKS